MGISISWSRQNTSLLLILAIAVLLRISLAVYLGDSIVETRAGTHDQISYDMLAQRVAEGHGFSFGTYEFPYARPDQPTAFWSHIYTLFLATTYRIFGHHPLYARLFQAVIVGVLMPWLTFRIGNRLFNQRTGLISAAIVAVYAYFIIYAGSLMTESFYIVCILWSFDVAMRIASDINESSKLDKHSTDRSSLRLGLEFGIAMGLAIMLRQVIALSLLILNLWLLWVAWRRGVLIGVTKKILLAGLVVILFLSPFIYRNFQNFNVIAMPNTNAGFAFFWGNHPIYGTEFEAVLSPSHGVEYVDLIPEELRDLNEAELDRALLERGIQFVRDDPGRYVRLSLSRIPVYFLFWPTAKSSLMSNAARVFSFGILLPFMVAGLLLAIHSLRGKCHKRTAVEELDSGLSLHCEYLLLIFFYLFSYSFIHLMIWANVRYRLPIDIFLIVFAAYAIDQLLQRWSKWKTAASKTVNA